MWSVQHVCTYTEETVVLYSTVGMALTIFESSHPLNRGYRRYAATLGMIRYTLSPDLTMFRTDLIRNQSRVRSMTVRYKGPCTHAVRLYRKIKGERMISQKRRIKRREKGREKGCTEAKN
jgi:hypothetical protein